MKDYILFELKLIKKNRLRLKRLMAPLICLIPWFYIGCGVFHQEFLVRIFFLYVLISAPGATYGQSIFEMEAPFIDKLMISPFSVYSILKAKYYLYCIFAVIMVIIMLPTMLFDIKFSEILSSFFYAIGFIYFICFQNMRFNTPLLCLIVSMSLIVIIHQIYGENITLLIMCIIGIGFVLAHKLWLMLIAKNFEKNKYHKLKCLRKKETI
jgi:hypothetical protein